MGDWSSMATQGTGPMTDRKQLTQLPKMCDALKCVMKERDFLDVLVGHTGLAMNMYMLVGHEHVLTTRPPLDHL